MMPTPGRFDDASQFQDDVARLSAAVGWSMTAPPPVVRQRLLNCFAEHHGVSATRERAHAYLVHERELLVVRGDDHQSHAIYSCSVADIAIRVEDGVISGQVIPIMRPTPAAFSVTVIEGPRDATSLDGDEDGRFSLGSLPEGTYRIVLDNTHLEIELDVEVPGGHS